MGYLELPDGVRQVNPKPINLYYDNQGTPYVSVVEANSLVPIGIRYKGLTVNIANDEYWYRTGVDDINLIKKIDASILTYVHSQGIAAQVWYIIHNLDKRPAIHCEDMSGNEIIPQIVHTDDNNAQAVFGNATYSGTAHCN